MKIICQAQNVNKNKMKYFKYIFFIGLFLFLPNISEAADRYWVGGGASTNWNATSNTNWSATSGGSNNASVPGASDNAIFDVNSGAGTSNISASITVLSATFTGFIGTLTHSAGTLTITTNGSLTLGAGMTYTPSASRTAFGSGTTLTTAGQGMSPITIAAGTLTLQDNLTFMDLKQADLILVGALDMNGFTVSGNSATSRILITSNILGTQRTITRGSGAFANADFRDIDLEASYNCSAITGLCGDAGGNSADFTFTTATTNYWIGNTGNWNDVNEWASTSGGSAATGRVPLPQDDATFDANSFSGTGFTVTANMPRVGTNIDFSAVGTDNPTWTVPNESYNNTIYGSLTLASGMAVGGTNGRIFEGRGSFTLTNAGVSYSRAITISMVDGTLTLLDAYSSVSTIVFTNGTFDADVFSVTGSGVSISGSATKVINMGSGTWTVTGTGSPWGWATSGTTLNEETSTIVMSNTLATAKTFAGAGETYNNLTITGDNVTITGNNTFNVMALNNPDLTTGVIIGTGSTQTITNLTTTAAATDVVVLSGVAGGGTETLTSSTSQICVDYLTITNLTAAGTAAWYAGANSTDGTGNGGWLFEACPSGDPNSASRQSGVPNEKVRGGFKVRGGVKFR
ncbi:MAG: hypothetical protein A3A96_00840 [Candidatus Zambryskibacteria bacterium RIFCSPLOWO2_01_FULL_39_39]|uniref:G8 domain-containing protein n=1 Tax=Candidatus Zambryskibacteria bacterium RIFCSPLOWO2_01_FULL_39_39 TaxID=1802758 RepID=A0A1G2TYL4_9BACT|nr:MAG: hypothetical protein A3B88_03450 [Candidatus Zambryskibacteria bacterium RIFCSPHIGHO2_02_FULL_39_19]OHA98229.1 MAG: hypothetical protein A3F20_04265 [Candidatus Zambryskibacteria bacterium RIFCSPHIGHO2_12_FULL_39_21]OHB02405.1 MAG: hypothetical protein A3A96_00840 [Candidatus Zambryskibacteria bacterium RIFCSPLOWO2_01_FULL_39_39]